jgi:hypothetical protein
MQRDQYISVASVVNGYPTGTVGNDRIRYEQLEYGRCVRIDIDAVLTEAEYRAVLDMECRRRQKLDAVQARSWGPNYAVDPQVPQSHGPCARRNHDAVRAGYQHGRNLAAAIDRYGFRDRYRAEASGIQDGDFASGRRLGNCPCESLAGSRSTAGIGVVSDAGHPRTGRLGTCRLCGKSQGRRRQNDHEKLVYKHGALSLQHGALPALGGIAPLNATRSSCPRKQILSVLRSVSDARQEALAKYRYHFQPIRALGQS